MSRARTITAALAAAGALSLMAIAPASAATSTIAPSKSKYDYINKCDFSYDAAKRNADTRVPKKVKKKVRECVEAQEKYSKTGNSQGATILWVNPNPTATEIAAQNKLADYFQKQGCPNLTNDNDTEVPKTGCYVLTYYGQFEEPGATDVSVYMAYQQ